MARAYRDWLGGLCGGAGIADWLAVDNFWPLLAPGLHGASAVRLPNTTRFGTLKNSLFFIVFAGYN